MLRPLDWPLSFTWCRFASHSDDIPSARPVILIAAWGRRGIFKFCAAVRTSTPGFSNTVAIASFVMSLILTAFAIAMARVRVILRKLPMPNHVPYLTDAAKNPLVMVLLPVLFRRALMASPTLIVPFCMKITSFAITVRLFIPVFHRVLSAVKSSTPVEFGSLRITFASLSLSAISPRPHSSTRACLSASGSAASSAGSSDSTRSISVSKSATAAPP